MKIFTRIAIIVQLLFLSSCEQKQEKNIKSLITKNKDLTDTKVIDSITYLKDFKESVDWDSTLVSKGKKVHILVSLVEDSNFFIPLEYTSSVSNSNKVIKQMCTKIELFSNDKPKSFLISVDDIKKYMGKEDEKIIKYGVLQLSKDDVSYSHDTLKLVYGYSIPYTDIGNQVTVLFNCTSLEKSINVEY